MSEKKADGTWLAAIFLVGGLGFLGFLLVGEPSFGDRSCQPILGDTDVDRVFRHDEPEQCGLERDRRLAGVALLAPIVVVLARTVGRGIGRRMTGPSSSRQPPGIKRIAPQYRPGGADPPDDGT